MSSRQAYDPQQVDEAQQQIRGLVHEIQRLCKSDLEPGQFYQEFLQRVVSAVAAIGGVVWTMGDTGRLEVAFQIHLRETGLLDKEKEQDQIRHNRLVQKVLGTGQGMLVAPNSGAGEDDAGNPTDFLLLFAPLKSDRDVHGVVEIFQRPLDRPTVQRGNLRFLLQMCDMVSEFLTTRQLRHFTNRQTMWTQLATFAREVHRGLDPRQTAYTLANEGRRLIECDRVSVAIKKGRKCVVEAVSGQDAFDRRANVIRLLNRLATAATATGDPVWFTGDVADLAPQVERTLQEYVDESHSRLVAVLPLTRPSSTPAGTESTKNERPEVIGALIVEQIEAAGRDEGLRQRATAVCEHGSTALANAVEHQQLFLMPLWRALGKAHWVLRARTLPKTIAVVAVIAAAFAALWLVPADFNLEARGTLEPVDKRDVFASVDGVVEKVLVEHAQTVESGAKLAELKNSILDASITDVRGRLDTSREQLKSVEFARVQPGLSADEKTKLSGQKAQLETTVRSLGDQLKLYEEKQKHLNVVSPIAGQVVTWQVSERLARRPVQPGQVLMTVADPTGPWELELHMPEDRMGHIAQAQKNLGTGLKVTYIMATDPGASRKGNVREIHAAAEVRGEEGNTVLIRVKIDSAGLPDLRPGATVTAKVHCGRRSIGYVWFHDLIGFVQSKILFRL